jgi:hypothetical protein
MPINLRQSIHLVPPLDISTINKRLSLCGLLMDQRLLAIGEIETELTAVHAYDGEILFFFRGPSDGEAFDLDGLEG